MFFEIGSKEVLGLDVGTNSIKMVELETLSRGGALLKSFAVLPTPTQIISNGEILDTSALASLIHVLCQTTRSNRKKVCVGISGPPIIVKKITMPRVEKKVLEEQVKWEAEQYIPFDLNDVVYTYSVLPSDKMGSNPDSMDLLLIAVQSRLIGQYHRTLADVGGSGGLKLAVADVSSFALANLFEMNYGRLRDATVALLNIGASTTNMAVVRNGSLIFARDILVGGNSYTYEISKELGCTLEEAESMKLSASRKAEIPSQVLMAMNHAKEALADEITNSFDFFSASNTDLKIQRVYYTGGGSQSPGLFQWLSQSTHLSFDEMDPFLRLKVGGSLNNPATLKVLRDLKPFLSIVLGLGLRRVGDS